MSSFPKNVLPPKFARWALSAFLAAGVMFLILAIRGDFPRFRSQLTKFPPVYSLIAQRDQVTIQAKFTHLNYFIPSFDYLVEFIEQPGTFNKNRLRGYNSYIDYYEQVVGLLPEIAEGHGMLGFLYYQEGDPNKAVYAYQKAVELNPYFFWFHYNLGILYSKNGQYAPAASEFQRALSLPPEISLKIIMTSKVYQQLLSQESFRYGLQDSLRQAYKESYALLQLCRQYAGANSAKTDTAVFDKILLKIF